MTKEKRIIILATLLIIIGVGVNRAIRISERFTANRWKDQPDKRSEMIDDIVRSEIFHGKPRNEIIKSIGQPSSIEEGFFIDQKEMVKMRYKIGFDAIGQLNEYLNIDLVNDTVIMAYKHYEKENERSQKRE